MRLFEWISPRSCLSSGRSQVILNEEVLKEIDTEPSPREGTHAWAKTLAGSTQQAIAPARITKAERRAMRLSLELARMTMPVRATPI